MIILLSFIIGTAISFYLFTAISMIVYGLHWRDNMIFNKVHKIYKDRQKVYGTEVPRSLEEYSHIFISMSTPTLFKLSIFWPYYVRKGRKFLKESNQ